MNKLYHLMVLRNDVKKTNTKAGETIWISERLILECGIVEYASYFKETARKRFRATVPAKYKTQSMMPDTGASWRYAKFDQKWYYDLERIPGKEKLPKDLMLKWLQAPQHTPEDDFERAFKNHVGANWRRYLPYYEGLSDGQAQHLSEACAAIDFLVQWQKQHEIPPSRLSFYAEAGTVLGKHKMYLPDNFRRLQEKVLAVYGGSQVWELVKLRRAGNSNALKFDDPQVTAWAMVMRMAGYNFTNSYIIRMVQTVCLLNDKAKPSTSWLEKFLAKPDSRYLMPTRWGANGRRMMNHKGYIPMAGAIFAGDCWLMDGTRMNLIEFRHKWTTKGGAEREGYAHLTVVMVFDEMSGMFVAREYGIAESEEMYQNAIAKAVQSTGYLPWELVTDRFPGYNTEGWETTKHKLEKGGTTVTESYEMEGKARLERAIRTLQDVAMQHSAFYYGEGIQSSHDYAHRSEEVLKAVKKTTRDEWDYQAAVQEAERIFEMYNNMPYSAYSRERREVYQSPKMLHEQSQKPHTAKYDPMEALQWWGRTKQVTLGHQGMIVTEIMGAKYHFVIDPDTHYHIIKGYHECKVTVHYDLEDLSRVVLADPKTGLVLCDATIQERVQIRGPQADMKALGKAKRRLDRIQELTTLDQQKYYDLAGNEEAVLFPKIHGKERANEAETAMLAPLKTIQIGSGKPPKKDNGDDDNEGYQMTYDDIISRL